MDDSLKCNIVSCRKSVSRDAKAVVTNCSHIFCRLFSVPGALFVLGGTLKDAALVVFLVLLILLGFIWANSKLCKHAHLLDAPLPVPGLPGMRLTADRTVRISQLHHLLEPGIDLADTRRTREDVVCTSLNPSADYKSSVLSGLPPTIVLEIANRALNFWAYQQSMEATFQHMLLKQAHERAATAEKDRDIIQNQADSEIRILSERLALSESELNNERRKVSEAAERHRNAQKQYEKLKANFEKVRIQSLVNSVPDPRTKTPLGLTRQSILTKPQVTPVRGAPVTGPEPVIRSFGTPQNAYSGALSADRTRVKQRPYLHMRTRQMTGAEGHSFGSVRSKPLSNENLAPRVHMGSSRTHSRKDHSNPMDGTAYNTSGSHEQFEATVRPSEHFPQHVHTASDRLRRVPRTMLQQPG